MRPTIEALYARASKRGLVLRVSRHRRPTASLWRGDYLLARYVGARADVLEALDRAMPARAVGAPAGNRNASRANRVAKAAREQEEIRCAWG